MTKYLEMKGEKDMSNLCQWSFEGYFANYIFHNEKTAAVRWDYGKTENRTKEITAI